MGGDSLLQTTMQLTEQGWSATGQWANGVPVQVAGTNTSAGANGIVITPAGSSAPYVTLTVEQAVQGTLAHNASLRAARAGLDEAEARVTEARSGFFPRISVTESWQRGDQPVFVFSSLLSARRFAAENFAIDALNHAQPIGFFRTGVALEQLLFDGGRQRAAATAATLSRTMSEASTRSSLP